MWTRETMARALASEAAIWREIGVRRKHPPDLVPLTFDGVAERIERRAAAIREGRE